jgi:hypothetical protein
VESVGCFGNDVDDNEEDNSKSPYKKRLNLDSVDSNKRAGGS